MKKISRSALVPVTAEQMFLLVDDIEAYPDFLPWCSRAEVHSRTDNTVEATLELHRGIIRKSFTTLNEVVPGESIKLELADGPFRYLQGAWTFKGLGDAGSKVSFNLEFEFDNPMTNIVFAPLFEETCNSLVDMFTQRAIDVYEP